MIDFVVEPWMSVKDEIAPLWARHHAEIGEDRDVISLDPDFDAYEALADAGRLHILAARHGMAFVGYVFCIVGPHLHYRSTIFADMDLYWIAPEHRGGRTACRMFEALEVSLKARGVVKIVGNTKLAADQSRLLSHLGYREAERIFVKVI